MLEGGCTCRAVRYRMTTSPMIVHCCHCRWCQRESGASFGLNAVVERDRIELLGASPELVVTPSESGKGQKVWRCSTCKVAVWSHYPNGGERVAFVRVGTLDTPDALPPDVHIYAASKQPWVTLPPGASVHDGFYNPAEVWKPEARARWAATRG
jgi:hypothetical protein